MFEQSDQLEILMLGADFPFADESAGLEHLLAAFSAVPALQPEFVQIGKRQEVYSTAACAKALVKDRVGQTRFLSLSRISAPVIEFRFTFIPDDSIGWRLAAKMPLAEFSAPARANDVSIYVINLLREFSKVTTLVYGYAHSLADRLLGSDPHRGNAEADKRVYEVYWLNLYGSSMVNQIGRERLRNVPCHSLEWLPDGGCIYTTQPDPGNFATLAARQAQTAALVHLCPDRDGAEHLEALERRSAALAPVTPAFDTEIADLLNLILDTVDLAHRPAEILRLNAYRPPPVAEHRGVAVTTLSANVEGAGTMIEHYRDFHAERFIALLHREVPSIVDVSPDVLPAIDFHFWLAEYPRMFKRADIDNDLVPAVGAFLGEMMVNNLHGRWLPHHNLDEAGVILGDQLWLPFLRARRFLGNREAALDYSLTQFYRVAARSIAPEGG